MLLLYAFKYKSKPLGAYAYSDLLPHNPRACARQARGLWWLPQARGLCEPEPTLPYLA